MKFTLNLASLAGLMASMAFSCPVNGRIAGTHPEVVHRGVAARKHGEAHSYGKLFADDNQTGAVYLLQGKDKECHDLPADIASTTNSVTIFGETHCIFYALPGCAGPHHLDIWALSKDEVSNNLDDPGFISFADVIASWVCYQ